MGQCLAGSLKRLCVVTHGLSPESRPAFPAPRGGEGGEGAHPETLSKTAPTHQRAPWMIGRAPGRRLALLHDTAYTAHELHKLPAEQCRSTVKSMSYSAKCRLCRICKLMKPLKTLAFYETASVCTRSPPQNQPPQAPRFFYPMPQRGFCMDNWIIASSYHHHITASPAHSQDNTHAKRGGL